MAVDHGHSRQTAARFGTDKLLSDVSVVALGE